MGDHYPLCEQYISGDGLPCICELLSQHADDMHIAMTADLRVKVEALPEDAVLYRGNILDLIAGISDE